MADPLKTVLLLALPASGKSEVRRYLAHLSPEQCARDFHMGPTVQLDDFPYVHIMRRVDEELAKHGKGRIFFHADDKPFRDGRDWGTLIHLLNEDYEDLVTRRVVKPASAARHLFARMDAAAAKVGVEAPRIGAIDDALLAQIAAAIEPEAAAMLTEKQAAYPASLDGRTVVVEFARGGPDGSSMPLPAPYGYRYSLAQLSPALLEHAAILYVWVTPEESRRKNHARTDPNDPGSILHHGVPIEVMLKEYGCDDMDWLEARSSTPGAIALDAHGRTHHIRIGRFDNRVDKTSFLRAERADWAAADVAAVHAGLKGALDALAR